MATYQGLGIVFGTNTVTGTGVTGKLTTIDQTKNAEVEAVRDENGATVSRVFYDPSQDATFEYVVTGASSSTAATNCTIADPGSLVTITGTGGAAALGSATVWSVESGAKIAWSNVGAAKVTLPLKRYAGITATVA